MKKKKVDKLMHLRSYTAILLIYVVDYDSIYLTWKIRSDSYWLWCWTYHCYPYHQYLKMGVLDDYQRSKPTGGVGSNQEPWFYLYSAGKWLSTADL